MKQWYYAKDGEQKGPVIEDDLIALLQNNEIPSDSLIWSEGMAEWTSAKDIGLAYAPPAEKFHNKESIPLNNLASSSISKESHHTASTTQDMTGTPVPEDEKAAQKGIGRGAYFGLSILLSVISAMLGAPGAFILIIPSLILGGMRYLNIGCSPWSILMGLIPIVNLVVLYECLAFPPGYAQTKQSDTAMKIVSRIYFVFLIVSGALLALAF